ncbi:hypothetical protein Ciccas_013604 [Cichlidogyrus casuarinus]|uniref:Uncharacterized protein n=1 Tax=Cichlidogyrus casuarinus TaxID=1844966 RepID=A0ABD2PLE4_9PLAT
MLDKSLPVSVNWWREPSEVSPLRQRQGSAKEVSFVEAGETQQRDASPLEYEDTILPTSFGVDKTEADLQRIVYRDGCLRVGVNESGRHLDQIAQHGESSSLSNTGLGARHTLVISVTLKAFKFCHTICLKRCTLDENALACLTCNLHLVERLKNLNLSETMIGIFGASYVKSMLATAVYLETIDLSDNAFSDLAGVTIAEGLEEHRALLKVVPVDIESSSIAKCSPQQREFLGWSLP